MFSTAKKTYQYETMLNSNPLQLPRLAIPKVEETLARYQRSLEPFADAAQLLETQALINSFEADAKQFAAEVGCTRRNVHAQH